MSKGPIVCVSLGSGKDAWVMADLETMRFVVEIDGRREVETLSLADLRNQYPRAANAISGALAEAVRVKQD